MLVQWCLPWGGGGGLFAIIVIHRGVLLDNGIARQLLPALHGYFCYKPATPLTQECA